ncbi:MAG: cobaltochelatase subunit CobN, partial [Pseudomonadota bacterium]|nr:cobaltochelatase subunit CobN [Pseudomonadota bacterium]
YLAFYWWLREAGVDAIIHLGTHGNLEWLPGKAVALSSVCWPEIALGPMPVIYPYIVSDPGEAAQAKRRISAITLSHLTPPLKTVTLAPELAELEKLVDEYSSADGLDARRMRLLRQEILHRARRSGLAGEDDNALLTSLEAHLCDIKEQRVSHGLHVFGEGAENEVRNLLTALAGRFVPPGPGGSPSRGRLDVLPTGRNLIAMDPRLIPTRTAAAIGRRAAEEFVRRYAQDHGDWPKSVMLDVWGSATLRNGGDEIAQALWLMGVRPAWDEATGRVVGFDIIPETELSWPRIDVSLRISGLFRDMFPYLITLFDDAVQAVFAPQGGKLYRIFGNAPGAYGTGVSDLIDQGNWAHRDELGQAYLQASQFAYGRHGEGEAQPQALRERIANADALVHVQDQRETDILSGADFADAEGGFAAAAKAAGSDPALYHMDTSQPDTVKARTLAEEISLVLQSRALNPEWIAGQTRHGYAGAAAFADIVDQLFAFAATSDAANSLQFSVLFDAYVLDDRIRTFIAVHNPDALKAMAARFDEALRRGFWQPLRNSVLPLLDELCGRKAKEAA